MNCFVCKNSRWNFHPAVRGGVHFLRRDTCVYCSKQYTLFLTQPQLRQNTKGFEELISKPGIEFIASDKFNKTIPAIELAAEPKMSNLYLYHYGVPNEVKTKSVRGRGEVIQVTGQYLYEFVRKKMTEYQMQEIKQSKVLTDADKQTAVSMLSLHSVSTSLGYTPYMIFS